jgi:hypothetical protein
MNASRKVLSMPYHHDVITSVEQLLLALQQSEVDRLVIRGSLTDVPGFRLRPGQALQGDGEDAALRFVPGSDGVELSSDNELADLGLHASPDRRAIRNDSSVASLGRIRIADVTTTGQVQILVRDAVRGGHVDVQGLDIVAADATARSERPAGYGVQVLQGAFTLWNMQGDESVAISARLTGLAAGREGHPVLGSGILVSGGGFKAGRLIVSMLETRAIYSHGRIPAGTADVVSGGVFAAHGAHVDQVQNRGPVVTYGVNDMVLDNWGHVDHWAAEEKLTSYGASGIGFVNFGTINDLKLQAPVETFGVGARGFTAYAGTVQRADFDRITTHGDGAVGIQIGQPIGRLVVRRGIKTFGGTGQSLVRGVVRMLSAAGLCVKPGGAVDEIEIDGGITTAGRNIAPLELQGVVGAVRIVGGIAAAGEGFDKQ